MEVHGVPPEPKERGHVDIQPTLRSLHARAGSAKSASKTLTLGNQSQGDPDGWLGLPGCRRRRSTRPCGCGCRAPGCGPCGGASGGGPWPRAEPGGGGGGGARRRLGFWGWRRRGDEVGGGWKRGGVIRLEMEEEGLSWYW